MMKVFLLICVALVTGVKCGAAPPQTDDCAVSEIALTELEDLKRLVNQLTLLVETIIGTPIPKPPFEIIDPTLTVTWNEVTLAWTLPEGAIGFTAEVISEGVSQPIVRLSPVATSFTTTQIETGVSYTIKITPIKGDGPGDAYISDLFTPECPQICALIFAPVCGTDGNTYSNNCAFEIAKCETGDAIEVASEGPCDPCENVQCSVPDCPDGFKIADTPIPGDCCVGCIDICEGILCETPVCYIGYIPTFLDGDCCAQCERQVFSDCSDAMANGMTDSGVYSIQPLNTNTAFDAYCDMETDGGKWTVILRRTNSTVDFYRDYDEYVEGFGDVSGAFWIGLEKLYRLNKQGNTELVVHLVDQSDASGAAKYRTFRIGPATDNYPLEVLSGFTEYVSGFSGTIGNAMFFNKGAPFSARDMDNNAGPRDCAAELVGGWWYKGSICSRSNPLGEYLQVDDRRFEEGIFWAPFRGKQHSLKFLEMKIRNPA